MEMMDDMDRRQMLSITMAALAGLGTDFIDEGGFRLGTEPLDAVASGLDRLRDLDGHVGAARVLVPATWLADRLGYVLVRTRTSNSLHRRLGELTADAALLASWAAFEIGDPRDSLRYSSLAHHAGTAIQNPDLRAAAGAARAHTLDKGLGDQEQASNLLGQISLDGATTATRIYIEAHRGRAFARSGKDSSCLHAFDRAAEALPMLSADGTPPALGAVNAEHVLKHRGHAMVELGHGDEATKLLGAALRRQPARLLRGAGAIHARLAEAAALTDEPDRAVDHVLKAHRALTSTGSVRRLGELRSIITDLSARFPNVRGVRQLPERLRADLPVGDGRRYVTCRSMSGRRKVHQARCPTLRNKGAVSRAEAWPDGDGLEPAEVAAVVAARPAEARPKLELCQTCLVAR